MQSLTGPGVLPIIRAHGGSWGLIGNLKAPNGRQSYIMSPATFFNVLCHYYMPTFHYALILANAFSTRHSLVQSFQCIAGCICKETQHSILLFSFESFPFLGLPSGFHIEARSEMPDFKSGFARQVATIYISISGG